MLLKTHKCYDDKDHLCKIVFNIDRDRSNGVLNFAHETCIGYDIRTGQWHGDEINADGWVTLSDKEISEIVEKYDLELLVKAAEKNDQ